MELSVIPNVSTILIWTVLSSSIYYGINLEYFKEESKMTWMYQKPEYEAVKTMIHERYNLYFYGEGKYFKYHKPLDNLQGVPVLFVPGSGGSYKQCRSIGSVLYQVIN